MKYFFLAMCVMATTPCFGQEDPLLMCMGGLQTDPRFSSLSDKIALNAAPDTTFTMLADTSFANDAERQAISTWATARKECVKSGEAYWRKNYPIQIFTFANEAENSTMAIAVDLYNKKLSFGEFNKRRQALADDARNKMAAIIQQIVNDRDAKQQGVQQAQDARIAAQQRDQAARQEAQRQFEQAQQAQQMAMDRQALLQHWLNNYMPRPFGR